jgi:quercetin dioxygenase-like cupin family protein
MARVTAGEVPPLADSPLALATLRATAGDRLRCGDSERDTLLYVHGGGGVLSLDGEHELAPGTAVLVLAGESAEIEAGSVGLEAVQATVGPGADRHAPLGRRDAVMRLETAEAAAATGARSFQILFGPHNGSSRATLFAGFIPPGKAPWHYHLYDEIVWVPAGPGRLHIGGAVEELGAGSAFRLRPREVHIVENASADRELAVVGIFTPAGSPSAAYLTPDVAAEYRFAG